MNISGKSIVELAAELSVGSISADAIKNHYGDGILSSVLAIGGGSLAGALTGSTLNVIDRETGIVSDIGELIDDVFSIF
jgi:hypothetical protein